MRVLAYDIRHNPYCLSLGVEYMSVDELLPQCHVVSLHCPLLPSTRHIINVEAIKKMRPGTMLINVSRCAAQHPMLHLDDHHVANLVLVTARWARPMVSILVTLYVMQCS
jgi:hypothetical protein